MKYLAAGKVETVGLYAYLERIAFYRRLGFKYDSEFVVLKGEGFHSPGRRGIRKADAKDVDRVIDYDRKCLGISRSKLLRPILLDPDNLCYVSLDDGQIQGYVVAKVYDKMAELGPLLCRKDRSDVAVELLRAVINSLEGFDISVFIPKKEESILELLSRSGFEESFRVARMFLGPAAFGDFVYGAESLERG